MNVLFLYSLAIKVSYPSIIMYFYISCLFTFGSRRHFELMVICTINTPREQNKTYVPYWDLYIKHNFVLYRHYFAILWSNEMNILKDRSKKKCRNYYGSFNLLCDWSILARHSSMPRWGFKLRRQKECVCGRI